MSALVWLLFGIFWDRLYYWDYYFIIFIAFHYLPCQIYSTGHVWMSWLPVSLSTRHLLGTSVQRARVLCFHPQTWPVLLQTCWENYCPPSTGLEQGWAFRWWGNMPSVMMHHFTTIDTHTFSTPELNSW